MTSPEWEAANEDDSDRFPQTSHASAPESTESHERGSRVVPDPARVARYAEAQCVMVGGRLATTAYDAARFRISERAALVAERDLLAQAMWDARGALGFDNDGDKTPVAWIHGDYEQFAVNHVREAREQARDYEMVLDLWDGTERREWVARAETAEAKVAKVEALADEWKRDKHRVLDDERDPQRRGWRRAVEDCEADLRAVLADAPAEQRADRRTS